MYLNKWGVRLALAALIFAGALACRTADVLVSQAVSTPTRTPRPTFTPLPTVTNTPLPTATQPPPPTPVPTRVPTRRPTAKPRPTSPPPTPVPVVQPPPPPPAPKFEYGVNPPSCTHAGGSYIKGKVYDGTNPDAGGVPGIQVALGGSDGVSPWVVVRTFDDGVYSFTLTPDGGGAKLGTYHLWVMDNSGKRISDVSGPLTINGLGPDAPNSCWAGSVDFWKR